MKCKKYYQYRVTMTTDDSVAIYRSSTATFGALYCKRHTDEIIKRKILLYGNIK